jgi:hypothetical protein
MILRSIKKQFPFFSGIALTILVISECGIYSFSGSTLPPHIKTVAVPLFEDKTTEFGIDQKFTDGLIDAIIQDNTLKIADPRSADALVRGEILRVEDRAGQYNAQETASDYRVSITAKVAFEDVKKRQILWEETWTQWGSYTDDREAGIDEAIKKISTEILNRTVSGW